MVYLYERFFLDTGGFETERLAFELMHERTANLKGIPGHNIGLDLLNEFMNADLKGKCLLTVTIV
jgi:hypothetical protein